MTCAEAGIAVRAVVDVFVRVFCLNLLFCWYRGVAHTKSVSVVASLINNPFIAAQLFSISARAQLIMDPRDHFGDRARAAEFTRRPAISSAKLEPTRISYDCFSPRYFPGQFCDPKIISTRSAPTPARPARFLDLQRSLLIFPTDAQQVFCFVRLDWFSLLIECFSEIQIADRREVVEMFTGEGFELMFRRNGEFTWLKFDFFGNSVSWGFFGFVGKSILVAWITSLITSWERWAFRKFLKRESIKWKKFLEQRTFVEPS